MKAISLFIFFLISIQVFCQDNYSQIYSVVQEMPVYPGGEDSMWRFINTNVKYPDSAIAHNIEGKLIIGFVVNQDGSISDVVIRRGLSADIDSEGMRVIRLMPHFSPGRQDGKAVRVSYTLPISFKLKVNPADTVKKYKVVEHMPEFPGGDSARNHFIVTHIDYPEYARDNEIQGKVVVDFIVNEDGSLSDFSVVEKVYPSLDAEALRLVKLMPKYIPGTQDGKPVRVHFRLPIGFKIVESTNINSEPDYSDVPEVYTKVGIMPEYPGGRQKLIDFINSNIRYPKEAKDIHVQGTIIVRFIVDESGKLSHFGLEQTGYYLLNEEAMRLAKMLPTFTPGMQNGKPVKVIYTLPIRFKLNDWEYFDPLTKDTAVLNQFKLVKIKINYPEKARDNGIQGQVIVGFTINTDGHISDYKILKSVHPLLDAEALRVTKLLPGFKPHTGDPIKIELPVDFKLDEK